MTKIPILSVIIGIRDWEITRLRVAINSHLNCTMAEDVEVVVSDFGSENHTEVEKLATELGCTYVYTDDELWSRSRALNAGIVASSGEFILGTDADIIFAPETHAITVDYLRKYPQSLQLKQCRDLPESVTLNDLETVDWAYLDSIARTRPRWGMGGLAACRRDLADKVRGYDERMVVWGAEDNDFGKRLRASGAILNWMTDKAAQIYHVWHPPFLQTHPDALEIFERNKKYLNEDPGIIRNLHSEAIYRGIDPIVSVVIATKDRADYLRASIQSVLNQSFREFELIVIDDGSEDDTQDVLNSFTDQRIKRMRNETSLGVAGARNKANATARGHYIAVHDDDDLMLPMRLEQQLGLIQAGVQGAYGGWVDFDNESFDATFCPGKEPFELASMCFSGGVLLHPTLMAKKTLFKRFPYHDSFLAGSDYNVAFRMAWHGARLEHCGSYVTLRRIHSANMTSVSATTQKASSLVTTSVFLNGFHKNLENEFRKEAKAVKEIAFDLTPKSFAEMVRLVPLNGAVEVIDLPPGPVGSYHGDEELVLSGRLIQGGLKLDFERRNGEHLPLNQEDESREEVDGNESPVQRHVVNFKGLSVVREEDDIDALEVYGRVAATVLSQKENWIVLHTNECEKLSDALERTLHLLPPTEELLFICRKGTWMAAFENQPGLRGTVLARKLSISDVNGEFHNIQVVSQ